MAEILTESFCERCGTRYTFESAAPRTRRLGGIKTLSRGLKNFVMSDDSSLDEALAAARSDAEREATSQQLDAFHKAFNFCMSCRQYTCANCWNSVEGRCLTCAPHLGHEILPAPFPDLDARLGLVDANGSSAAPNGHGAEDLAWPTVDLRRLDELAPDVTPPAAVERVTEPEAVVEEPEAVAEEPEAVDEEPEAVVTVAEEPDAVAAVEPEAETVEEPDAVAAVEPESAAVVAAAETGIALPVVEQPAADVAPPAERIETTSERPAAAPAAPAAPRIPSPGTAPRTLDEKAAAAAARTAELLARFRPGQSLDAALDEYEASVSATEAAPAVEDVETLAEPGPAPDIAAPELVALDPAAELPEAEPLEPQPEPLEPVAASNAEPGPPDDRVELPGWRIVAPDPAARTADGVPAEPTTRPLHPPAPGPDVPSPSTTPQWPSQPAPAFDSLAFLTARRDGAPTEALWVASSRDVVAATSGATPVAGVQSCVSCGLALSANARFCRRCGSRQHD